MGVEAIAPIGAGSDTRASLSIVAPQADFGVALSQGIRTVDESLRTADQQVRLLASGQQVAPHDVMISMEEARMHLMLLSEVRNRVVGRYR